MHSFMRGSRGGPLGAFFYTGSLLNLFSTLLTNTYPVDENIADKAIELRRVTNMKLADAVIATTAMLNNLKLATRNMDDFETIAGLDIINPIG